MTRRVQEEEKVQTGELIVTLPRAPSGLMTIGFAAVPAALNVQACRRYRYQPQSGYAAPGGAAFTALSSAAILETTIVSPLVAG